MGMRPKGACKRHAPDVRRRSKHWQPHGAAVASEVRSAFFDLQQADRVLESETKNVQTADEALDMARGNFAAGLGTQLDVLQAAIRRHPDPHNPIERDLSAQRGSCTPGSRLRQFSRSA